MSKLKELREKQANILTLARQKLDEIKDDTPEVRAKEIEAEHDRAMVDFDAIAAKIEREQKIDEAEQRAEADLKSRRPPREKGEQRGQEEGDKKPEYKEVYVKAMRFGAAELDAEERHVLMTGRLDLSPEARAQSVGTTTAGGFTVPQGFSGEIDKAMAMWGPMLDTDIARQYPTATGNAIPWPTIDDTVKNVGLHTENAAVTDDGSEDMVFGQKTLAAYIYDTEVVRMSIELLQDSAFDMASLLTDLFGERLGRKGNSILTIGTGSAQPQGVVVGSSLGKTAAGAAAITSDELIDLQHSVDPAYRMSPKCRWMFNDSTFAVIRKLKDGQNNYLWQMGSVIGGAPPTLLDKPFSVNQAMANVATAQKSVLFGDFSRFIVRRVGQFQTVRLNERYMDALQVGFIGFMRLDGRLLNSAAVKHLLQA